MVERPRNLPHLYLRNNGQTAKYRSPRFGRTPQPLDRDRRRHAEKLQRAIDEAIEEGRQQLESRLLDVAVGKTGFYLEFEVVKDDANAFENLENKTKKIELVSVKPSVEKENMVKATIFVPDSATDFFQKKVEQYCNEETKEGNPRNAGLISRIENIEIATVRSLFTDDDSLFPENERAIWWEVWLRREQIEGFKTIAQRLNIPTKSEINFPERTVVLAMANVETMEQVIQNSDTVAELRIAKDTPSFLLEMGAIEQERWVEDLWNRTLPPRDDAVAVCLLDTGVNWRHKLIERGLDRSDLHTCNPNWGTHDHKGHGTNMAGLILYSDLFNALVTTDSITLTHRLESVKLVPPNGQNEPELYGAITEEAVSRPEIQNPKRKRVFCMAITSPQPSPNYGIPSSWSAAIDKLCFEDNQRLIVISAGNITQDIVCSDYLTRNDVETIENPGQAWNGLVVGAYTEKVNIVHPDYQGWQPVAPCGDLSPRSRTSISWQSQWPIRPDVVFEGGNYASDGQNPAQNIDDLCLLTTHHHPHIRSFDFMSDTSAATALVSYMAAYILSEKPKYWPETIRALIVHSAEWTPAMQKHFAKASTKKDKRVLLRRYGYGVPDLERALKSANNDLTLIVESQIKPFVKEKSDIKTNYMNFHDLPWPTEELQNLKESNVELKVTLSYFIEPNPGERGWKKKHSYASYGLRFEVKKPLETDVEFKKRINKAARGEDEKLSISREDDDWFLGANLRNKGSLHSDRWNGSAVELAQRKMIGVYPVGGWWKEKSHL